MRVLAKNLVRGAVSLVLAASLGIPPGGISPAAAQSRNAAAPAANAHPQAGPPIARPGEPPHAWLFGAWTGGLFPAPSDITAAQCLAQPTVIFTRDTVLRATLTDPFYLQRGIESVRTSPTGADFRLADAQATAPDTSSAAAGMLGVSTPTPTVGFGCDNPEVLHVQIHSQNEISFPGCKDFPNPLVRCPAR